jgi:hypothetical protein
VHGAVPQEFQQGKLQIAAPKRLWPAPPAKAKAKQPPEVMPKMGPMPKGATPLKRAMSWPKRAVLPKRATPLKWAMLPMCLLALLPACPGKGRVSKFVVVKHAVFLSFRVFTYSQDHDISC